MHYVRSRTLKASRRNRFGYEGQNRRRHAKAMPLPFTTFGAVGLAAGCASGTRAAAPSISVSQETRSTLPDQKNRQGMAGRRKP